MADRTSFTAARVLSTLGMLACIAAVIGGLELIRWFNGITNSPESYDQHKGLLGAWSTGLGSAVLLCAMLAPWSPVRSVRVSGWVTIVTIVLMLVIVQPHPLLVMLGMVIRGFLPLVPAACFAVAVMHCTDRAWRKRGDPAALAIGSLIATAGFIACAWFCLFFQKLQALGWAAAID